MSAPAGVLDDADRAPIPGLLVRLALPILASQALRLAYQWVDALWVRGLGVEATAAVTTSVFVMWWVYALNDIFAVGITAYVSQLLGAGERRRAGVAAYQGLRASAVLGLFGSALGLFGSRAIFRIMDPTGAVVDAGTSYLSVVLTAAPLPMMALTCESIMRAAGDTRTPLLLDLGAVALNAVLAPLFIYGVGPFPRLGVAGAGWATVIAQGVLVVLYLILAARGHRALPLARHAEGVRIRIAGMARVGAPVALIGMLFSVVYIAFSRAASQFGPAAVAMIGVANRIEAIQFILSASLGMAGATLVGQNLGAGRPDRAEQVMRVGSAWVLGWSLALTVVLYTWPGVFIGLFSSDPEMHRVGEPYLRTLSLCLAFVAVEIVNVESVIGSGRTRVVSWIFTSFSLARIPLAFWVPQWTGGGMISLAWLINITCAVRAVLIVGWVWRGTWKQGLTQELRGAAPTLEP